MSKQHDLTAVRLAHYFKQEIYISAQGQRILHPRVIEIQKYLVKHIKPEDLESWYNGIIRNYKFMPTINEIGNEAPINEAINYDEPADLNTVAIAFSKRNKVSLGPPPGMENVKVEDMIEDCWKMNAEEKFRKFGINLVSKFLEVETRAAHICGYFENEKIDSCFKLTKQMVRDYGFMDKKSFINKYRKIK